MSIPESQLETWANQGAITNSQRTHESVRYALTCFNWPDDVSYDVYLQGSYRNSTNIRGDSDVDIVVQLNSTYHADKSLLLSDEVAQYNKDRVPATYGWDEFDADLRKALNAYYEAGKVTRGTKAIHVQTPYLRADVIPALTYRRYLWYHSASNQDYTEGMTFYVPSEALWIVNYPKLHYQNGAAKQSRTSDRFKRTVRMFKNARSYMVTRGKITPDLAPSYFLECLIYNVPDSQFASTLRSTYLDVLLAVLQGKRDQFVCQCERGLLFGEAKEQWSESEAIQLIQALLDLWSDWLG